MLCPALELEGCCCLGHPHPACGPEGGSIPQGSAGKVLPERGKGRGLKPHLVLQRQQRLEELYICFKIKSFSFLFYFDTSLLGVSGFLGHLW